MKLKSLILETTIPNEFAKLFRAFPKNATRWNEATDEIREVCKILRETYNEIQLNLTTDEVDGGKGVQSLNFRTFKTPSEWNSKSQEFILILWRKMNNSTKREALRQLKVYVSNYF